MAAFILWNFHAFFLIHIFFFGAGRKRAKLMNDKLNNKTEQGSNTSFSLSSTTATVITIVTITTPTIISTTASIVTVTSTTATLSSLIPII